MNSRRKALSSLLAIVLGVLSLVEWHANTGIIKNYFSSYVGENFVFYLVPMIISMVIFLISFEIIPIIVTYLIFFLYVVIAGQIFNGQIAYNYGLSFILSFTCIWFFKRLLSY